MANKTSGTTVDASASEKQATLLVAVLASFLTPFLGSATNVALTSIATDLEMTAVGQAWIQTAYMLGAAMVLLPVGRLADIVGRKKIFVIGIAGTAVVALGTTLAPNGSVLIGMRLAHGMTNALIFGTSAAMVTSVYGRGERGGALGMTIAAVYIGLTCGPALGGWLTKTFGWRSIFYAVLPLAGLILLTVFTRLKREWAHARGQHFDWAGAVLYSLGIMLVALGLNHLEKSPTTSLVLLGLGALYFIGFFGWESRGCSHPLMDMSAFRQNRVFILSNFAAFLNYTALTMIPFFMSVYLQEVLAFNAMQAGLLLLAQPLLMATLSPMVGRLSDRMEPRWLSSSGMVLISLGLIRFVLIDADASLLSIYLALGVIGLGMALFSSPNVNAIMSSVGQQHQGLAAAMMGTMRLTGNLASMSIARLLVAVAVGAMGTARSEPEKYTQALNLAFAIASGLALLGAVASLARGRLHGTEMKSSNDL